MTAVNTAKVKATQLINDLQDVSVTQIALIVIGTWLAIYLIRRVLPFIAERGPSQVRFYLLSAVPIIRLILIVSAIIWIVPIIFNVNLQNFLIIAGGVSVAIGFAFKDYVSSLIAGIVTIIERPYRPGDWVEINGDYGEVKSLGMRAISIVTASDDTIVIPHEKIWTENISNSNDGERTLMCVVKFHLEPNHDAKLVKQRLYAVAITSAFLHYDRPVKIIVEQTLFGTCYKIKAYPFDARDQFDFITDITVRTKKVLQELEVREVNTPYIEKEFV